MEMKETEQGMVARLAEAYVDAIPPALPADPVFGPGSIVWRVHTDLATPVAGVRSLLLQALHPLAMAGVAEHSNWRSDMFGRLASTSRYVNVVTFGAREAAEAAASRVRRIHTHVHGTDPITGSPYPATDERLLLWVHLAMVESYVASAAAFGDPLSDAEAGAYYTAMTEFAALVGIARDSIPHTAEATTAAIAEYADQLRSSDIVRESIGLMLDPPGLDDDTASLWADLGQAAIATLPSWAADLYGYTPRPLTDEYRTEVRQLLGAFDFGFEMEPGVAETRARILAWMHEAAPSR